MSAVHPLLLAVILITAAVGYFIGKHATEYSSRREEEAEAERHMEYLSRQARDLTAAKDIRIFGLGAWLEDLYRAARCPRESGRIISGFFSGRCMSARNTLSYLRTFSFPPL